MPYPVNKGRAVGRCLCPWCDKMVIQIKYGAFWQTSNLLYISHLKVLRSLIKRRKMCTGGRRLVWWYIGVVSCINSGMAGANVFLWCYECHGCKHGWVARLWLETPRRCRLTGPPCSLTSLNMLFYAPISLRLIQNIVLRCVDCDMCWSVSSTRSGKHCWPSNAIGLGSHFVCMCIVWGNFWSDMFRGGCPPSTPAESRFFDADHR